MQKTSEKWLLDAARICAVTTAFALPISITALSILYPITLFLSLINFRNWELRPRWWLQPVILVSALYFLLYVLGLFYSDGTGHEQWKDLQKHFWLFGTILLMPLFTEKKWRDYAINAFLAAMVFTLILSYAKFFGLFHWRPDLGVSALFNNYIVQSILLAFAAVLILDRYLRDKNKPWYLLAIAILIVLNIFFFSEGRSGYFTFALLFAYLVFEHYRLKGLIPAFCILLALMGGAYFFSNTVHQRVNQVFSETQHYSNYYSSIGRRYAEASNGWYLIKKSPWIGYGTGGIGAAYHNLPADRFQRAVLVDQLDLDYLNILLKFGFIGLAVVFAFFAVLWSQARFLDPHNRYIARALVLFFLLNCIANDLMNTIVSSHLLSLFIALTFATLVARDQKSIKV